MLSDQHEKKSEGVCTIAHDKGKEQTDPAYGLLGKYGTDLSEVLLLWGAQDGALPSFSTHLRQGRS